jgi:hypothetical protein
VLQPPGLEHVIAGLNGDEAEVIPPQQLKHQPVRALVCPALGLVPVLSNTRQEKDSQSGMASGTGCSGFKSSRADRKHNVTGKASDSVCDKSVRRNQQ